MVSKLFRFLAVLAFLAPTGAFAQGLASVKGVVKDSSGGSIPGAVVKVVAEAGATAELVTDGDGGYSAASLAAGAYRVEAALDGFETAVRRVTLDRQTRSSTWTLTLAPAGFTEGVVVTARRIEEAAQEVPIPLSVVERRPGRRRRRLQREPAEGADPDGAVLLDQPAQLGDQHPRPRRAVRPHQRRHRAGRRPLHRRRVLRAPGRRRRSTSSTSSASRCCAARRARCSARTRPPAPSTSPRASRRSRRESDFELNYGNFGFVQAKASVTGPLCSRRSPAACRSRARSATARSTTRQDRRRRQRPRQPRRPRPAAVRAVGRRWRSPWPSTTRGSGRRAIRRSSPAWRRRCAPPTASTRRSPPTSATRRRASTRSIASPTSTRRCARIRTSAARRVNVDWKLGRGRLTSTTAWRYWDWNPSNDRDFIGLPITTISAAPSKQRQWTQEVRYAGDVSPNAEPRRRRASPSTRRSTPTRRSSRSRARPPRASCSRRAPTAATPGLLDGYGYDQFM